MVNYNEYTFQDLSLKILQKLIKISSHKSYQAKKKFLKKNNAQFYLCHHLTGNHMIL